jgi:hypothetical protein
LEEDEERRMEKKDEGEMEKFKRQSSLQCLLRRGTIGNLLPPGRGNV